MRVSQEQFERNLREKFGGKYTVATWETIVHEESGEEVIHVGLAKAELTFMEAVNLPAEVDGVAIVYSYVGPIEMLTHGYYEPLIGGVSFGAIDITAGTYGGVVYDKDTDEPYLLTNEHVVSDTDNIDPNHPPMGWPILQPGPIDGGRKPAAGFLSRVCGLKEKALRGEPADNDTALVLGDRETNPCEFFGLGHVKEYEHVNLKPGDKIIKSGRTTGVTTNTVASVGVSANIGGMAWGNPVIVENVIQTKSAFVKGGDSGSRVWKQDTMEPGGIVFAGSWLVSLIIPAQTICDTFGVRFGKKKYNQGGEEMDEQKSIWEMKELWMPIIIGIAGALAFLLQHTLGIEIAPELIVSIIIALVGVLFGVGWTTVKKLQSAVKTVNELKREVKAARK